jgi:hypothetical protein
MRLWILLCSVALLSGCAIGLDSVLFLTKTQVAIDADTEPPSLDLGYAREEFVLAPIFEDGQVLPVMTTIGMGAGLLDFVADQSFATGDAAVVMADAFTDPKDYFRGFVKRSNVIDPERRDEASDYKVPGGAVIAPEDPIPQGFWRKLGWAIFGSTKRKRYFFGTDTNLGLHVEWTGNTMPRAVNLGYKRKELAYVPLMEKTAIKKAAGGAPAQEDLDRNQYRLASLIATASGKVKVRDPDGTAVRVGQTYATGDAATLLAANPGVRRVLGPSLVPRYEEIAGFATKLEGEQKTVAMALLRLVYGNLSQLADDESKRVVEELNKLDQSVPSVYDFDQYTVPSAAQPTNLVIIPRGAPLTATGFDKVLDYRSRLETSVGRLKSFLNKTGVTIGGRPTTPEEIGQLYEVQRKSLDTFDVTFGRRQEVVRAVEHYCGLLTR